jgi:hypothetical protein
LNNFPFHLEQPIWLLIPVFLVSVAISAVLYYRFNSGFSPTLRKILFAIRFLVLFILGLLLLNPNFYQNTKILNKPVLLVAVDNTESMLLAGDSGAIVNQTQQLVQQMTTELSEVYDIDLVGFNHEIQANPVIDFSGKRTDLGAVLNYAHEKYYMLPKAGIVLLTDGNNNRGVNPQALAANHGIPVFPVVFGDTNPAVDAFIDAIYYNKTVKAGAQFPVDVVVQAHGLKDEILKVQISKDGKLLQEQEVRVSQADFSKEVRFMPESAGQGSQAYQVSISPLQNERNHKNNESTFYVRTIESGEKILVLGAAPHPDLGAIASALWQFEDMEVEVKTLINYPIDFTKYQLIIAHGLPSSDERSRAIWADRQFHSGSVWYIWSTTTQLKMLENNDFAWQQALDISGYEYVEAAANNQFTNFIMPSDWAKMYSGYPPLYVPFVKMENTKPQETMFNQSIRGYNSGNPLLSFWSLGPLKRAWLSGEGLWKWRLHNYQTKSNHLEFNTLIHHISKYLLTGAIQSRFHLDHQSSYNETDLIKWQAQTFNKAYEFVNDARISLTLTNAEGVEYQYMFSLDEQAYFAQLGYLKSGIYNYLAEAILADTTFKKTGSFVVEAWNMEKSASGANMPLLNSLAQESRGKVYTTQNSLQLISDLKSSPDATPRYSIVQKIIQFIELRRLLIILLILLGSEWVLRKRWGSY